VIADLARFFHTPLPDFLAMDWTEVAAWYGEAERIGEDELRAWRN
jgi:hypothetical protein